MNQLHPDIIAEVQSKALYSKEEESLLGTISSVCIHIHFDLCISILMHKKGWRGYGNHPVHLFAFLYDRVLP